ncbi:MAG TPA: hypothetical protein DHW40_10545 [Microbacterium sp.]|nr:hypothetical protein [Microbacterium sp.]
MDASLLTAPPALRELATGDAPFAGTLRAGDPPQLWTDAASFAASAAWAAEAADHLLTAQDSARTDEGTWVVLPHCPVRLTDLVERGGCRSAGAITTVIVSALRGAAQADALDADDGRWWVTAEGRPVLALTGTSSWREETRALLERIAVDAGEAQAELIHRVLATIDDARLLRREGEALEDEIFREAAAAPLDLAPPAEPMTPAADPLRRSPVARDTRGAGLLADIVERVVDGAIADRMRGAAASAGAVIARIRSRRSSAPTQARTVERPRTRQRAVAVAAAAAAGVIVVGVLWPAEDGDPVEAAPRSSPAQASTPGAPQPVPAEASPAPTPTGDPLHAGAALIALLAECDDDDCRTSRWEAPASAQPIAAASEEYEVDLVDEYGGVAALRVTGQDRTQIVVIVRQNDEWLVREVYDLADQP